YVRADGKSMLAITNEVGEADKFKEGMARTRINGKIGFFNQSLDMVLAPMYDYAFPFYDGVAEICMGCKESVEEGNSILDGGTWKRINRSGLVLEE
ncbi:MAG: WG repeat-containing protein, partial [Epsilonproteobacteria bacterium]|nr:WG repeat-containing protein [Campylobacterota bacterium]